MRRILTMTAALAFLSSPAIAQDDDGQVFNFEGDELSTDFLNPQLDVLGGLHRGRKSSLIKIRLDFVSEIVKSAEDI